MSTGYRAANDIQEFVFVSAFPGQIKPWSVVRIKADNRLIEAKQS